MNTFYAAAARLLLLLIISSASIVFLAAAPNTIRIQGRLTDNLGAPIEGNDGRIKMLLFSVASGGSELWRAPGDAGLGANELRVETNSAGLFSRDVGPLPVGIVSATPDIYMELHVYTAGGFRVLSPRQKFSTVPYAIQSERAVAADTAGFATAVANDSVGSEHIRPQSIDTQHLKVGAVTSVILASTTVNTVHLAAQSVTTEKLAPNAVTGSVLAPYAVTTTHIATGSVTNEKILSVAATKITGKITSDQIASEALGTMHLATGSVTSAILAPGSVQTIHLASQAVTTEKLAPNAVTSSILAPNAITSVHLAPELVTNDKILSLSTSKLTGQITGNQIAPGSITTTHMATGSVTGLILASATVGSGHILANAVSDIKISDVSAAKITGQLTNDQLAPIAATKITGPITTGQIGDGQVTNVKIAAMSASKLSGPLELGVLSALSSLKFGGFETLKILQIVNSSFDTGFVTGSTAFVDSPVEVSITPKLITSKILVIAYGIGGSGTSAGYYTIARGGNNLGNSNGLAAIVGGNVSSVFMMVYDSPVTTSAVQYKVQIRCDFGTGVSFPTTAFPNGATKGSIFAFEIGQ